MNISKSNLEYLDERISAYCERNSIMGSLRITLQGEIIFEKNIGLANIEKNIPFSRDSVFTLYSLSKPFCVLGLLKLVDRGLVDLDLHPSVYIPEAKGFDERVTIRHALHHISGLPDFEQSVGFAEKYEHGPACLTREHLKILVTYPQYFAPGARGMYANINMILAALIIENVTGIPYAEYMKKEVFEPLCMKGATVVAGGEQISCQVQGYDLIGGKLVPVDQSLDWLIGAGDIMATVDDVYKLNLAIKHRKLLSDRLWDELLTPAPQNQMGMGCTVNIWHDKLRITHNGGHIGFRTLHIQLPDDDFDVIFLSNCGFGNARGDILQIIHSIIYERDDVQQEIEMDKGYVKN